MTNIITQDWYTQLVEECRAIITEAVHVSRWALVEGYWLLGQRIVEDTNYQKWSQTGSSLQGLSKDIGQSERTLYYALQFYDKYPLQDSLGCATIGV